MQRGIGRVNYTRFLGFTKDSRDGPLKIVPKEADIVRRIFREYLDGFSPAMIASRLQSDRIPSPGNGEIWHASTISSMLQNEKYCGDFLMQKTFTEDYLTKKHKKNTGQLPQYYIENHHDPIIPKTVFHEVQGEILRRSVLKHDPTKYRCGSRIAFCGRILCGRCGKILKRYTRPDRGQTDWRCHNRAYPKKTNHQDHKSACGCRFVAEEEAQQAVIKAFNMLPQHRDQLIRMHAEICHCHLDRFDALLEKLNPDDQNRKSERETLLLERAEYAEKALKIRLLLELTDIMNENKTLSPAQRYQHSLPVTGSVILRCDNTSSGSAAASAACFSSEDFFLRTRFSLSDKILDGHGNISKFDNDMVIRYLDLITVQDDGLDIHFKAGITFHIPQEDTR